MLYGTLVRVAQAGGPGLNFQKVLENIPTDPASVFVYFLLLGSLLWIIKGSRGKGTPAK